MVCLWTPLSTEVFYLLHELLFGDKFPTKRRARQDTACTGAIRSASDGTTPCKTSSDAERWIQICSREWEQSKSEMPALFTDLFCRTVSPTLVTVALSKECFLWRNRGSLEKVSKDAEREQGAVACILVNLMTSFEAKTWRPRSDRLSGTDCHFHKGRYASVSDW